MDEFMLSTSDNPFNPFTHWIEWYAYDVAAGYHTSSYLARITKSSYELSDLDQSVAINDAIEEILHLNVTGTYIKVGAPSKKDAPSVE